MRRCCWWACSAGGTIQDAQRARIGLRSEVLTAWFELALSLTEHTAGFSPPVAARTFGYLGVTAYEAVAPEYSRASFSGWAAEWLPALPRPSGHAYHWPSVINAALAEISRRSVWRETAQAGQRNLQAIDAVEAYYEAAVCQRGSEQAQADSVAYGRSIAAAIYAWSRTDGGDQGIPDELPDQLYRRRPDPACGCPPRRRF